MKYKGEYQPSELLDPETNTFYPWSHVKPILDAHPHASFSRAQFTSPPRSVDVVTEEDDDESDDEELPFPSPPPPGFLDPITLPVSIIQSTLILQRNRLVPFPVRSRFVVVQIADDSCSFLQRGKTRKRSGRFWNVSLR